MVFRRPLFAFIITSGTAAVMGCPLLGEDSPTTTIRRPNVLWICSDDHAAYVTGCYGNRIVRTPHIDRLAAEGIRFDRAFCNSPMCTPSRQSFITGRYPRSVGVTLLQTPLPQSEITLAEMLREAGYETAAFGKMHFNSQLTHGFEQRIDLPDWRKWLRLQPKRPLPEGVEVLPPWRPFKDPASVWLNSMYLPYGAWDSDMSGTFFAQKAAEFLTRSHDKPFFLMVSFYEPHSPFHFPVEYRGRHHPEEFTVPEVGPEDDDQIPAIFRDLTDQEKRGINAAYYTSVEFMDKNVGIVLRALEESGLKHTTLVIYTSDHGYMLGHHGRFEKHCSFDPAISAPLIMSYPPLIPSGISTKALVEFVDIVPTILDICGLRIPERVQGRSLRHLLTGEPATHRPYVIVEYGHNEEICIRDEQYKFVYIRGKRVRDDGYDPGRPLPGVTFKLFDLINDPGEFYNLAQRSQHQERIKNYLRILAEHIRATERKPEDLPATDDPLEIIEYGVQPRDVTSAEE